ncbi:MAG: hypothetical protein PHE26_12455 [Syntrophomonadaceae bacterium]|nr:hypothetical protein [Syntrophomonadaceae bacterium]
MKKKYLGLIAFMVILCAVFSGCTREVKDKEITIFFQEKEYSGQYSGVVIDGIPDGEGEFKYENDDQYLTYDGYFKKGALSSNGKLKTNFLKIVFTDTERIGKYEGEVVDGIPNGFGTFSACNDRNIEYTYTGEWKDGRFDGQGATKWDEEETLDSIGTYKQGRFVPAFSELIDSLATNTSMQFSPSSRCMDFIKEHQKIFIDGDFEEIEKYLNTSIEYKHLAKTPGKYDTEIMLSYGTVQQIFENNVDDEFDKYSYTAILIADDYYNYYWVYYPGECEYFEGDYISFMGLPIGPSSFENVGGGTTLVEIIAACAILPYGTSWGDEGDV